MKAGAKSRKLGFISGHSPLAELSPIKGTGNTDAVLQEWDLYLQQVVRKRSLAVKQHKNLTLDLNNGVRCLLKM